MVRSRAPTAKIAKAKLSEARQHHSREVSWNTSCPGSQGSPCDAGVRFGPEAGMHERGLGLVSMRERIQPLSGAHSVILKPNEGTEITARVPWPPPAHAE